MHDESWTKLSFPTDPDNKGGWCPKRLKNDNLKIQLSLKMINALKQNKGQLINTLLQHDIDLEIRDDEGTSILMFATAQRHAQLVKFILQRGVNIDFKNEYGLHPIHIAIFNKDTRLVNTFLYNGVSGNTVIVKTGRTCLHAACEVVSLDIVKLLIKHKVNYQCSDKEGKTPLDLARVKYGEICAEYRSKLSEFDDKELFKDELEIAKLEYQQSFQEVTSIIRCLIDAIQKEKEELSKLEKEFGFSTPVTNNTFSNVSMNSHRDSVYSNFERRRNKRIMRINARHRHIPNVVEELDDVQLLTGLPHKFQQEDIEDVLFTGNLKEKRGRERYYDSDEERYHRTQDIRYNSYEKEKKEADRWWNNHTNNIEQKVIPDYDNFSIDKYNESDKQVIPFYNEPEEKKTIVTEEAKQIIDDIRKFTDNSINIYEEYESNYHAENVNSSQEPLLLLNAPESETKQSKIDIEVDFDAGVDVNDEEDMKDYFKQSGDDIEMVEFVRNTPSNEQSPNYSFESSPNQSPSSFCFENPLFNSSDDGISVSEDDYRASNTLRKFNKNEASNYLDDEMGETITSLFDNPVHEAPIYKNVYYNNPYNKNPSYEYPSNENPSYKTTEFTTDQVNGQVNDSTDRYFCKKCSKEELNIMTGFCSSCKTIYGINSPCPWCMNGRISTSGSCNTGDCTFQLYKSVNNTSTQTPTPNIDDSSKKTEIINLDLSEEKKVVDTQPSYKPPVHNQHQLDMRCIPFFTNYYGIIKGQNPSDELVMICSSKNQTKDTINSSNNVKTSNAAESSFALPKQQTYTPFVANTYPPPTSDSIKFMGIDELDGPKDDTVECQNCFKQNDINTLYCASCSYTLSNKCYFCDNTNGISARIDKCFKCNTSLFETKVPYSSKYIPNTTYQSKNPSNFDFSKDNYGSKTFDYSYVNTDRPKLYQSMSISCFMCGVQTNDVLQPYCNHCGYTLKAICHMCDQYNNINERPKECKHCFISLYDVKKQTNNGVSKDIAAQVISGTPINTIETKKVTPPDNSYAKSVNEMFLKKQNRDNEIDDLYFYANGSAKEDVMSNGLMENFFETPSIKSQPQSKTQNTTNDSVPFVECVLCHSLSNIDDDVHCTTCGFLLGDRCVTCHYIVRFGNEIDSDTCFNCKSSLYKD